MKFESALKTLFHQSLLPVQITLYYRPGVASEAVPSPLTPLLICIPGCTVVQYTFPHKPSTALLQVLWTGMLKVTLMSALTALLDIHLHLLLEIPFSKEWRDLATRIPLTEEELHSLLYWKPTPLCLIKSSIMGSLLEGGTSIFCGDTVTYLK